MQKETNCSILIRGKGSVKPGQRKHANQATDDEQDDLQPGAIALGFREFAGSIVWTSDMLANALKK